MSEFDHGSYDTEPRLVGDILGRIDDVIGYPGDPARHEDVRTRDLVSEGTGLRQKIGEMLIEAQTSGDPELRRQVASLRLELQSVQTDLFGQAGSSGVNMIG